MHRINSKLIVGGPENQVTVSIKEQKEMGTMLSVRELILAPQEHFTLKTKRPTVLWQNHLRNPLQ